MEFYKFVFYTKEKGLFYNIFNRSVFYEQAITEDFTTLVSFYNDSQYIGI